MIVSKDCRPFQKRREPIALSPSPIASTAYASIDHIAPNPRLAAKRPDPLRIAVLAPIAAGLPQNCP
jgi:hypothetical protein